MRYIKRFLIVILSFFSLGFIVSCAKGEDSSSFKLNYETKEIYKGDEFKLQMSQDGIILTSDVTFTSSNEEIAKIDDKGVCKGLKKGETDLKAKYNDTTLTCKLTVLEKEVISLSKSTLFIDKDSSEQVNLMKNEEIIKSGVTWSVIDPSIVSVNNGLIKGLSEGDTMVIAKYLEKSY